MFEIDKTFTFEAGHSLELHDGKCRGPHGHSYVLTVHLRSPSLIDSGPKTNMVMDFSSLSDAVKPMIEQYFDHRWINDTLKTNSPTVEFMARWIYDHLKPLLPLLSGITLYETKSSKVTYSPL